MYRDDWCPLRLTFSPSILEIRESKLTNAYSGGLREYLQSIPELESSLRRAGIRAGVPSGRGGIRSYRSKKAANKYPDIFVNFLAFIGSTGIAAGFYNVLKTWAEAKNGRKIRIKIGDFEVETTQMSEKQFMKLLDRLMIYKKAQFEEIKHDAKPNRSLAEMKSLRRDLLKSGFKVSPVESYNFEDEEVSSAAMDSIWRAQDALKKDLAKSKSSKAVRHKRRN
jgi:hypothetical protein